MSTAIDSRLKQLGIELQNANPPAANYVPWVVSGNLVFVSGQTCRANGEMKYAGKVGEKFSLDEGQAAARLCALNVLSQLRNAAGGNLDRVERCLRLGVFINCGSTFAEHARVANGASDLLVDVFGEKGRHTRYVAGCSSLPADSAIEIEAVFELAAR